jgi:hypothetical protein
LEQVFAVERRETAKRCVHEQQKRDGEYYYTS